MCTFEDSQSAGTAGELGQPGSEGGAAADAAGAAAAAKKAAAAAAAAAGGSFVDMNTRLMLLGLGAAESAATGKPVPSWASEAKVEVAVRARELPMRSRASVLECHDKVFDSVLKLVKESERSGKGRSKKSEPLFAPLVRTVVL